MPVGRQKRDEASKHGKRADSDDDYSSDDAAVQADPYFQHDKDDDAFNDPFFQVRIASRQPVSMTFQASRVALGFQGIS